MTTTAINDWKELASRGTDGLAVSLLWSKATDRVRVTVADERFDEEFDLDVAGRARARRLLPPVRVRSRPGPRLRLCDARVPRSAAAELKGVQPDDDRSRPVRPPLEDARRAVAEPGDHRARQHDPQRRSADAAGRVRRLPLEAAVDGRLLPARLRRPAARVRHARRPLRAQARAPGRRVDLRARQPRRPHRRLGRPGDRRARGHGGRRGADHARHPLDHRQPLHRQGARQGDRHLGGAGGGRDRARPADRWAPARVVRLVVRLHGQRAVRGRRAAARHPLRAREPRSPARLVRPARGRALHRRLQPPRVRDHRSARAGLDIRSHPRTRSRRPSCCSAPSSGGSVASTSRCSTSASSAAPASASAPRQSASPSSPCSARSSR